MTCNSDFVYSMLEFKDWYQCFTFVEKLSVTVTNTLHTVLLRDSVTFECSVYGNPPPDAVYWIKVKHGEEIFIMDTPENQTKYSFTNTTHPSLTINNVDDDDIGEYKCKAVNKHSEIHSQDIHVCVFGGSV